MGEPQRSCLPGSDGPRSRRRVQGEPAIYSSAGLAGYDGGFKMIDKNGGLNSSSTYIGFIPNSKIGIVLLSNRGRQPAIKVARQILFALAEDATDLPLEGADPD
jgi:hypothetical protein